MRTFYSGFAAVKATKNLENTTIYLWSLIAINAGCRRKSFLRNDYGMNVNYSSKHDNYYSAWTYVQDENFVESAGHPDLKNAGEPETGGASRARRNNKRKRNAANENHRKSKAFSLFI